MLTRASSVSSDDILVVFPDNPNKKIRCPYSVYSSIAAWLQWTRRNSPSIRDVLSTDDEVVGIYYLGYATAEREKRCKADGTMVPCQSVMSQSELDDMVGSVGRGPVYLHYLNDEVSNLEV